MVSPFAAYRPVRENVIHVDSYSPGVDGHSRASVESSDSCLEGESCNQGHTAHCHGAPDFMSLKTEFIITICCQSIFNIVL